MTRTANEGKCGEKQFYYEPIPATGFPNHWLSRHGENKSYPKWQSYKW